jgi:TATA-box binding protein (TBP) (component of TFIID and TFIIIB)
MIEKVTILKSGIMIIEGTKSEKEAYDFYTKLIVDRLKIPTSKINKEEDMFGMRDVGQESKK